MIKNKIDSLFPDDLISVTNKRMVTYKLQSLRATSDSVLKILDIFIDIHRLPTLNLVLRASDHEIWARQRESWGSLLPAPCLAAARRLLAELLFEFIMCVCLLILLGITFWGRNVLAHQLNCNFSSSFPFKLANSPVSGTVTVDIPGAVTLCASRSYTYSAVLRQCQWKSSCHNAYIIT